MPYHEIQVHIVGPKVFQRFLDAFHHTMVPCVVQLGGQPDLAPRNSGFLDTFPHFCFVAIGKGGINVAVAYLKSMFDSFSDDIGWALPGSEADGGDLVAGVEGEGFSNSG